MEAPAGSGEVRERRVRSGYGFPLLPPFWVASKEGHSPLNGLSLCRAFQGSGNPLLALTALGLPSFTFANIFINVSNECVHILCFLVYTVWKVLHQVHNKHLCGCWED